MNQKKPYPLATTPQHSPWLARFSVFVLIGTFVLLYAGGFTTTIKAGMVFLDWPTSNGSFNPPGWTQNEAMLAEHSHRLLGWFVGASTIVLTVWIWMKDRRRWLRWLSVGALGLVIVQGLLGGMRVLANSVDLAMVHGVVAQVFVCVLVAIAVGLTKAWKALPTRAVDNPQTATLRNWGLGLTALIFVQLVVAAVMRHRDAGLAIPTFPLTPEGGLIPAEWASGVAVHFAHRVLALIIFVVTLAWVWSLFASGPKERLLRTLGGTALFLLISQILLGALIIWTSRLPVPTTLHVINGAGFLACQWAAVFLLFKPKLEPAASPAPSRQSDLATATDSVATAS